MSRENLINISLKTTGDSAQVVEHLNCEFVGSNPASGTFFLKSYLLEIHFCY